MGSSAFIEIATISTVPCMEINNISVEWLAVLKLCILTTVFKEFCCCVPVKNISWKESYITWKWAYCITHIKNFNQIQKTEGRVSFTRVDKYKGKTNLWFVEHHDRKDLLYKNNFPNNASLLNLSLLSLFLQVEHFRIGKAKSSGVLTKSFLAEDASKRREHITVNLVVWHSGCSSGCDDSNSNKKNYSELLSILSAQCSSRASSCFRRFRHLFQIHFQTCRAISTIIYCVFSLCCVFEVSGDRMGDLLSVTVVTHLTASCYSLIPCSLKLSVTK